MLRAIVMTLGVLAIAAGALPFGAAAPGPRIYLICVGAAIIAGTAFERWRYRNTPPAGAHWERTGERFEDPSTGETMEVHYDRASGERRYVRTGENDAGRQP
ncbi:MAG: hypothetical protein KGL45_03880 [Gammaproteobacteria bacterium]|nr:hypothetical protein [Gammaproteobacteria bacterium]MDE2261641.1 hypothetical protein [Gammaproteobacteria bacterium]